MPSRADTLWTPLDLRDAIVTTYAQGKWIPAFSDRFGGVSRQYVEAKLKKLPKGLVDDEQKLSLTRATNSLLKIKESEQHLLHVSKL